MKVQKWSKPPILEAAAKLQNLAIRLKKLQLAKKTMTAHRLLKQYETKVKLYNLTQGKNNG